MLAVGAFLTAAAFWQPGFPDLLAGWGASGLADSTRLSDELRVGAGTLGVAIMGFVVRVLMPRSLALLLMPGATVERASLG